MSKFTLIFPFNMATEQLSIEINKRSASSSAGQSQVGATLMKQLVSEAQEVRKIASA
jgi:hypothetical protein